MFPFARLPLEAAVHHEGRQLVRCLLKRGRYVIGQERRNEIVVDEPSVSGQHARLSVASEEEIFIEDLGSANGTLVDGQLITGRTRLTATSEVRLGAVRLCLQRGGLPLAVFPHLPEGFLRARRYNLGEAVIEGTTSTIYEAYDTSLGRDIALKTMRPASQTDVSALLRFIREAQITSQLEHPGILPIYELGLDEQSRLYYTTRFIEGQSLAEILHLIEAGDQNTLARHRLPMLLNYWQRVGDTVAFAHSRGVVHTALRPEYIEIGPFGEVFTTNWGLAKLMPVAEFSAHYRVNAPASSGPIPLGPHSAPEQAAAKLDEIGMAADIFALGALLYQILTLHPPLPSESEEALLAAALEAKILDPAARKEARPHWPQGRLPAYLTHVAMKALKVAPAERHSSVSELQQDVAAWQEGRITEDKKGLWKQVTEKLGKH